MFSQALQEKSRRDFLKLSAAGVFAVPYTGWMNVLASHAAATGGGQGKAKAGILLWMAGGPSHKDTFDLKPGQQGRGRVQADRDQRPGIEDQRALPEARQGDEPRRRSSAA